MIISFSEMAKIIITKDENEPLFNHDNNDEDIQPNE